MIEKKTTKEIIDENVRLCETIDEALTEKGIEDKYKVWVSLEDLRKEISKQSKWCEKGKHTFISVFDFEEMIL